MKAAEDGLAYTQMPVVILMRVGKKLQYSRGGEYYLAKMILLLQLLGNLVFTALGRKNRIAPL